MTDAPYRIRRAAKRDLNLIFDSWLRSYRDGDAVGGIPDSRYYATYRRIIERLLPARDRKDGRFCVVLVDAKDDDKVIGWACGQTVGTSEGKGLILHYVYVKLPFRGFDLGKVIVDTLVALERPWIVFYTHGTACWRHFRKKHELLSRPPQVTAVDLTTPVRTKDLQWIYDPFLVFESLPAGWSRPVAPIESVTQASTRSPS